MTMVRTAAIVFSFAAGAATAQQNTVYRPKPVMAEPFVATKECIESVLRENLGETAHTYTGDNLVTGSLAGGGETKDVYVAVDENIVTYLSIQKIPEGNENERTRASILYESTDGIAITTSDNHLPDFSILNDLEDIDRELRRCSVIGMKYPPFHIG